MTSIEMVRIMMDAEALKLNIDASTNVDKIIDELVDVVNDSTTDTIVHKTNAALYWLRRNQYYKAAKCLIVLCSQLVLNEDEKYVVDVVVNPSANILNNMHTIIDIDNFWFTNEEFGI